MNITEITFPVCAERQLEEIRLMPHAVIRTRNYGTFRVRVFPVADPRDVATRRVFVVIAEQKPAIRAVLREYFKHSQHIDTTCAASSLEWA